MKFDEAYRRLQNYEAERNYRFTLLPEAALQEVYQHIVTTTARDCLELGTGFGATTCIMAAAVDEIGGGTVTTIDHITRNPDGVAELAQATGLTHHIRAVTLAQGYDWFLLDVLRQQVAGNVCEPCFDFCFLDGAHEWIPDALATFLVVKLLRPGRWLMLDDLHFKLRGSHPGWEESLADRSDDELDTRQIGMVFDLLVKTHPELRDFMLTNGGHMGWARKAGGTPDSWLPNGVIASAVCGSWTSTCTGAEVARTADFGEGVTIAQQADGALIRSTIADAAVSFANPFPTSRPIDFVTLRVRLISPDLETLQLFWLSAEDQFFNEASSQRCIVRSLRVLQDLTFCFRGPQSARTIRMFRIDPADGPCEMLLERITIGGW
jgi:predicted O-methyltransferase YrrM